MPQLPPIGGVVPQDLRPPLPPIGAVVGEPRARSSQLDTPAEPSTLERIGTSARDLVKANAEGMFKASGIPGFVRNGPVGAIQDQYEVGKSILQSQFEEYRKAKEAQAQGRTSEMVGHSVAAAVPFVGPILGRMGEQIGNGQISEAIGEGLVNAAMFGAPKIAGGVKAARGAFADRAVGQAAKIGARVEGDVMMAVPPSKSTPYTSADVRAAKPFLNEQHAAAPITSTVALREALDAGVGKIEGHLSEILDSFPEAQLHPGDAVARAIGEAFKDNPRGEALATGIKELSDLPLNRPNTLPELDRIRLQLNAENNGILKKNNYDRATARKVDPGFAAREAAASAIRDTLYDYLEERGVEGVRQLRRDEGSLIKLRDAVNRHEFAGQRPVPGADPGIVRKVAAQVVKKGATAAGAYLGNAPGAVVGAQVGEELAGAIKGTRSTRDSLIERAFSKADDRMPSYPTVPARPPIAGQLGPGPIVAGPGADTSYVRSEPATVAIPERLALPAGRVPVDVPAPADTSGRIPATLPENVARPRQETFKPDEIEAGTADQGVTPHTERVFMLRWLADDLREMTFQPSARMRGQQAVDEMSDATSQEAGRRAVYSPRVAGTPTQETLNAAGFGGTKPELAERIDRQVKRGKLDPKLEAVADAYRQAWDGERFDWDLIDDATLAKTGLRRRDFKSPMTMPSDTDMPDVHQRFFGAKDHAAEDASFAMDDAPAAAAEATPVSAKIDAGAGSSIPEQLAKLNAPEKMRAAPAVEAPKYEADIHHVTTPEQAAAIRREGFKLGKKGLGGDDFGPGVYMADAQSDAGSFWADQIATKNETGSVATEAMRGRVGLHRPLVLEDSPSSPYSRNWPTKRQLIHSADKDLIHRYDELIEAGHSANRAIGQVAKEAGYDGLVIKRRGGTEIVAFDPSNVKFHGAK